MVSLGGRIDLGRAVEDAETSFDSLQATIGQISDFKDSLGAVEGLPTNILVRLTVLASQVLRQRSLAREHIKTLVETCRSLTPAELRREHAALAKSLAGAGEQNTRLTRELAIKSEEARDGRDVKAGCKWAKLSIRLVAKQIRWNNARRIKKLQSNVKQLQTTLAHANFRSSHAGGGLLRRQPSGASSISETAGSFGFGGRSLRRGRTIDTTAVQPPESEASSGRRAATAPTGAGRPTGGIGIARGLRERDLRDILETLSKDVPRAFEPSCTHIEDPTGLFGGGSAAVVGRDGTLAQVSIDGPGADARDDPLRETYTRAEVMEWRIAHARQLHQLQGFFQDRLQLVNDFWRARAALISQQVRGPPKVKMPRPPLHASKNSRQLQINGYPFIYPHEPPVSRAGSPPHRGGSTEEYRWSAGYVSPAGPVPGGLPLSGSELRTRSMSTADGGAALSRAAAERAAASGAFGRPSTSGGLGLAPRQRELLGGGRSATNSPRPGASPLRSSPRLGSTSPPRMGTAPPEEVPVIVGPPASPLHIWGAQHGVLERSGAQTTRF